MLEQQRRRNLRRMLHTPTAGSLLEANPLIFLILFRFFLFFHFLSVRLCMMQKDLLAGGWFSVGTRDRICIVGCWFSFYSEM
jgi:hypothetical protein